MSQLRLGRNPDGTRHIVVLEPAVGRITHTRSSIPGGIALAPMVPKSQRDYPKPEGPK